MRSYKHDIVSWSEGTRSLGADEYRVFHVVVQLIYLAEGPLPFSEKELATRCNMPVTRLRKATAALVAAHKMWFRDGRAYVLRVLVELQKTLADCPAWDLTPDYREDAPGLPLGEPVQRSKAAPKLEVDAAFDRFWLNRAQRKGGDSRKSARDVFGALVASGVKPETIEAGMKRHIISLRSINRIGTEFVPETFRWLKKHGFADDDPEVIKQNVVKLDPAKFAPDDWHPVLRLYRVTNSWKTQLHGPEPGLPGCLVPAELLTQRLTG